MAIACTGAIECGHAHHRRQSLGLRLDHRDVHGGQRPGRRGSAGAGAQRAHEQSLRRISRQGGGEAGAAEVRNQGPACPAPGDPEERPGGCRRGGRQGVSRRSQPDEGVALSVWRASGQCVEGGRLPWHRRRSRQRGGENGAAGAGRRLGHHSSGGASRHSDRASDLRAKQNRRRSKAGGVSTLASLPGSSA